MTPEEAQRLREPFPESAIGHLPKAGVMLDYVGHAATTDRLLAVDPDWSWAPYALDEQGLPALDPEGNLWIRLTVCGVTRPGVGDGKTQKERIGDAIRNAAMRFGVALDLWAKEDLQPIQAEETLTIMERQKARIRARQLEVETSNGSGEEEAIAPAVPPPSEPGASPSPLMRPHDAAPGDAPAPSSRELKPTKRQLDKLNLLVGKLRDAGAIKTEHLWAAIATVRNIEVEHMIELLEGRDEEHVLHWSPLRKSLLRGEASDLLDRLDRLEANVRAA